MSALAILLAALFFVLLKNKDNRMFFQRQSIKKLPNFKTIDIFDNIIDSNDFIGNVLYVQFLDPGDIDDIQLFQNVFSSWSKEGLRILAITNDWNAWPKEMKDQKNTSLFITEECNKLKENFRSPLHQNHYYIFDDKGELRDWGQNNLGYEKGPKIRLKELLKNEYFKITDFIPYNDIFSIPWFENIVRKYPEIRLRNNYIIVALFASFCNSCLSAVLVEQLKEIARSEKICVIGVLNSDYFAEEDVKALRSQLEIEFLICLSDKELTETWSRYIREFREDELNNIIIVAESSGHIQKLFHKNCGCYEELSSFGKRLINE